MIKDKLGAGAYFGIWTLIGKLCLAISALSLPALAWFGYQPGNPATGGAGLALALAYAGLPCLFKLAALAALREPSRAVTENFP